jgi:hypothetical protein
MDVLCRKRGNDLHHPKAIRVKQHPSPGVDQIDDPDRLLIQNKRCDEGGAQTPNSFGGVRKLDLLNNVLCDKRLRLYQDLLRGQEVDHMVDVPFPLV